MIFCISALILALLVEPLLLRHNFYSEIAHSPTNVSICTRKLKFKVYVLTAECAAFQLKSTSPGGARNHNPGNISTMR